jgi:hypothetical protein
MNIYEKEGFNFLYKGIELKFDNYLKNKNWRKRGLRNS